MNTTNNPAPTRSTQTFGNRNQSIVTFAHAASSVRCSVACNVDVAIIQDATGYTVTRDTHGAASNSSRHDRGVLGFDVLHSGTDRAAAVVAFKAALAHQAELGGVQTKITTVKGRPFGT